MTDVSRLGRTTRGRARRRVRRPGARARGGGPVGSRTVTVTTVHEIELERAGAISLASHDVPAGLVVASARIIGCRHGRCRVLDGIAWDDLTGEKVAAGPMLSALRAARR